MKPIYSTIKLVITILLFSLSGQLLAQVGVDIPANTDKLDQLSSQWKKQRIQNLRKARKIARERDMLFRYESGEGEIMEIQGVSESGELIYYVTDNRDAAESASTDKVWPGGSLGYSLKGDSMTVGEWDGGAVRLTHHELTGRSTQTDGATSNSDHATHVAGTLIGGGADTSARGMAYNASLSAHDWNFDDSEMATAAGTGLLISNHSYGSITGWFYNSSASRDEWWGDTTLSGTEDYKFGFYNNQAQSWDQIAWNAPYYLIVKSAGNDRNDGHTGSHYLPNHGVWSTTSRPDDGGTDGYDCISTYGNSKNIMTVGAVSDISGGYSSPSSVVMSSFSGWGPTDDGRIKPDIVANGIGLYSSLSTHDSAYASYNGTSMASPSASGSMLLVQEHYNNENGVFMKSATLKGLIIHTADEAGSAEGPDYQFGWGMLNTASAVELISDTGADISENTLTNSQTYSFNFTSNGLAPIKATICWTDLAGTPPAASNDPTTLMLVNDLDMRIIRNSDTTNFLPYVLNPALPSSAATKADNFRDNVEKIYIEVPQSGSYTLQVTHKGVLTGGSQNFSLIFEGGNAEPIPMNCALVVDTFPYVQDFESFALCSTTPGAACALPTLSGWENDTTDVLDWTTDNGGTTSTGTGPTTDYNPGTATGRYLYVEATNPSYPDKDAYLLSPCFALDTIQDPVLEFAYHMYGSNMGSLNVDVRKGGNWINLWSIAGDQGNQWFIKSIDLSAYEGDTVQFRFRGKTGNNFRSDIAIDDIFVGPDICEAPSNLAASNIQDSSAVISWTTGGASNWEIEIGVQGFTLGTGFNANLNFNPVLFTGLFPSTTYDFYVRDSCGPGEYSEWVGPLTFSTCSEIGNAFGTPFIVNNLPYSDTGTTAECFSQTYGNAAPDAFYRVITSNCADSLNVSLCGSGYDTYLYVLNTSGGLVAFNDDDCGLQSNVENIAVSGGDTLFVVVDGYSANSGSYVLSITEHLTAPAVNISSGSGSGICQGDSTLLTATAGTAYQWYLNGDMILGEIGQTFFAKDSGSYNVAVTSSGACTDTSGIPFDLAVYDYPVVSVSTFDPVPICNGDTAVLNASAGSDYQWYRNGALLSGEKNNSIVATQEGNYNVLITEGGICADSAVSGFDLVVNPLPTPAFTSNATHFCIGDSVTLTTNPTGGEFVQWMFNGAELIGDTFTTYIARDSGFYNLLYVNTFGCGDSAAPVFISEKPLPTPTILSSSGNAVCAGDSTTLSTDAYSAYQWYRNGLLQSSQTNQQFVTNLTGNYNVTVVDSFGCQDSSLAAYSFIVNSNPLVTITPGGNTTFCDGESVTLSTISGTTYQWYQDGVLITGATQSTYVASVSGRYNVLVTNASNCTDSAASGTIVTVNPLPAVNISALGPTAFCFKDSTTLSASTGNKFQWYVNGALLPSDTFQTITVKSPGNYNVYVTNSFGCSDSASSFTTITVFPLPTPMIVVPGVSQFCVGDSTELIATGGLGYQWTLFGQPQIGAVDSSLVVYAGGLYNVIATDINNCSDTAAMPVTITVNPLPVVGITANGPTTFCEGDSVELVTFGGISYQWYRNGQIMPGETNANLIASQQGSYNVLVFDINQCFDTAFQSLPVSTLDLPVVSLADFDDICNIAPPFTLTGGNPAGGVYSGNSVVSNQFYPSNAGVGVHTLVYTYSDSNNCENSATNTIEVANCTGIDELSLDKSVRIYPVPTSELLKIELTDPEVMLRNIQIYDVQMNLVFNKQIEEEKRMVLNVASYAKGTYFIRLQFDEGYLFKQLIVE